MKQILKTQGRCLGLLLVLLLLVPSMLRAQVANGVITGRLTDSTGAVIPNAQLTLTKTDTGLTLTTQSNSDGIYS
ncbi:carboxypeptidase-like regulatory domain-containing protein, partial [Terriglobus sp. YAF25]